MTTTTKDFLSHFVQPKTRTNAIKLCICPYCCQEFTRTSSLLRHIRNNSCDPSKVPTWLLDKAINELNAIQLRGNIHSRFDVNGRNKSDKNDFDFTITSLEKAFLERLMKSKDLRYNPLCSLPLSLSHISKHRQSCSLLFSSIYFFFLF
jgi:hypothetical protein